MGHVEALRVLKDLGCPMAEEGNDGWTTSSLAAQEGHVEALRALKDLGCSMAEKSNDG